jgi:DNA-binding response OmpR family regulator
MLNVLLIEDDQIMLKAISNILKKNGYNVISASDGKEAFEMIDNAAYDVVITDLMMPYASGMEMVSRVEKIRTFFCGKPLGPVPLHLLTLLP